MWSRARLALLPLALTALWWSSAVLPIFRSAVPAREFTERIIADDRFKPGALRTVMSGLEGEPKPAIRRSDLARAEALVHLHLADEVIGLQAGEAADQERTRAEDKVSESLALNPADSFLWLTLYSIKAARLGFVAGNIRYLDQSYSEGSHEGWIALRRNRLALSVFDMLGASTQQIVVSEFADLVDAGLVEAAAINLTSVGWPHSERLLAALQDVDPASKKRLRKRLLTDGIKVSIPGIELEDRPWQ